MVPVACRMACCEWARRERAYAWVCAEPESLALPQILYVWIEWHNAIHSFL